MQGIKSKYLVVAICAFACVALSNQAFADDPPSPPGLVATTPTTSNGTSTSTVGATTSSTNSGPTETIAFASIAVSAYLVWQKRRQVLAHKI